MPKEIATAEPSPELGSGVPHEMATTGPRHRTRWILSSIAAVGLVGIGLLGGMLIGENIGSPADHRGAIAVHEFLQHGQEQRETIPQRLRDRRQNERRDHQNGGQGDGTPTAPTPTPGNG